MFKKRSAQVNYDKEYWKLKYYIKRLFGLRLVRLTIIILGVFFLVPIPIFLLLSPHVQQNINYGVTFSNKYAKDLGLDWRDAYLKSLDDLKVKNLRLVAYWDETEPNADQYDFSNIKWQLDEAEKRNLNIIMAIGQKVPRYPECFSPNWWQNISNENVRDVYLTEYIKRAVIELRGYKSIKIWQVENEPYWPFGTCKFAFKTQTLVKEIDVVKSLDSRPILVQDSGEGGFWASTYKLGNKLGISMYRKIWYDFWGVFFHRFIYFQYPLANWTYKIKAGLVGVPYQNIIVTELQGEPWGPGINSQLTNDEKNKTMSPNDFLETISYAQRAGFKDLYLWGVEWWLWEKEHNNNPFYWDTAKALFNQQQ
jgi:hypothetical protein